MRWLSLPEARKVVAYEQIAERTGMSAFAIEKDWWMVQTLSIIFDMSMAKYLLFKGGTSLSKAWKLIDRFSEDVDLAIDRAYFGFNGELSKNQITALRKTAGAFTSGIFLEELKSRTAQKGLNDVRLNLIEARESDQDPRIIEVYYPNVIPLPGYLEAKVQIEIGCRSLREPYTIRTFGSLVDEHYRDDTLVHTPIHVPTVNPERTFWEKIFLLHEEFQRPRGKIRVNRLSRHLYDVVKLSLTPYFENALKDATLYETIVEHRYKFTRIAGVNYNLHQPQTINPLPVSEVAEAWRDDYQTMIQQMIYELSPPSFDDIIRLMAELKRRINDLPWKLKREYPVGK